MKEVRSSLNVHPFDPEGAGNNCDDCGAGRFYGW
jgi:hypothetical protein